MWWLSWRPSWCTFWPTEYFVVLFSARLRDVKLIWYIMNGCLTTTPLSLRSRGSVSKRTANVAWGGKCNFWSVAPQLRTISTTVILIASLLTYTLHMCALYFDCGRDFIARRSCLCQRKQNSNWSARSWTLHPAGPLDTVWRHLTVGRTFSL